MAETVTEVRKTEGGRPDRRYRWILLAILVLALALRALHFGAVNQAVFTASPVIDAAHFQEMAEQIASGRIVGDTAFQKAPLYPHLLAAIYAVAGVRIPLAIALQLLAGVLLCYVVFLLGRRLFGVAEGLLAALFAAVYRPFLFFEGQLLAAWLAVLLCALYLLTQEWASRRGGSLRWLAAGSVLGLAILVRGNMLFVLPFGLLWILATGRPRATRRKVAAGAALCLGALLPLVPATIHNYAAEGEFIPLTSTAGINLYTGNRVGADGFSAIPVHSKWEAAMDTAWEAEQGTTAERDRYWVRRTVRESAAAPAAVALLLVKKGVLFWDAYEYPNNVSFEFARRVFPILRSPLPAFALLAPLALAGIVVLWRRQWESTAYLGLFLLLYTVSVLPFFACDRYRIPAVPAILCLAAAMSVWIFRRLRAGEYRGAAVAILVVAAMAVPVNVDLCGARPTHLARDWVALGDSFRFAERYPEAIHAYGRARAEDPTDPDPHALAGQCLLRLRQRTEARRHFEEALRLDPEYTRPRTLLARLLIHEGRYDQASVHLAHLAEKYPQQVEPRILLGRAYLSLGRPADAEEVFRQALVLDPGSVPARRGLTEAREVAVAVAR